MRAGKFLLLAVAAALAFAPHGADAAKRASREKSRAHKTRSEKSARSSSSKTNKGKRESNSERGEFEQQWDKQQVEPELPESE